MTFKTFKVQRGRYTKIYQTTRYRNCNIPIDDVALERWNLTLSAFRTYPHIWTKFQRQKTTSTPTDHPSWIVWEYPSSECQLSLLNPRIPDRPWKDLLEWKHKWTRWALLATCASVYGAIHVSAWMHYFPNNMQRDWWRYSAITIASSGPLFLFHGYVSAAFDFLLDPTFSGVPLLLLSRVATVILGFDVFAGIYLFPFIYAYARTWLPIGAFISLRDLPVEVYQSTRWSEVMQAIPHL
jgi:hypothetical protein